MNTIFIIIVVVLILLAVSDLIVGVSNDAVNFLNSAIGAKAAPLRVILIVAALGVLAGATFSNGMMEVARKSIFHPEAFTFKEIMIIFLAVMLTDVILLDLFNTFGLPTSTTVSIVFELLGAAVGIAIINIKSDPALSMSDMAEYINSGKALGIISGILISVVVAFSIGAIVMWLSRLMFSFNITKSIKYFGGFFGGIAIASITYFILIKGLKGSSFAENPISLISLQDWAHYLSGMDYDGYKELIKSFGSSEICSDPTLLAWGQTLKEFDKKTFGDGINQFMEFVKTVNANEIQVPLLLASWVKYYTWLILLVTFGTFWIIIQVIYSLFKINILKIIVIIGTFALAMAFASNDLVNFIGVPLAGLSSLNFAQAQSADVSLIADTFMMKDLAGKVPTNLLFLLIAGLVMVITLWLSKKAKSVVKTTLNLSDQDSVNERFESSGLARSLVRQAVIVGKGIDYILPATIKRGLSKRFDSTYFHKTVKPETGVSFDLVRAAVNLVVASVLIAIGTSLKLPLSTTYVTFMVAMGTSLADGAWDRESAVYRITGVITVIGGWFFTALSAFTVALLVALFLNATWPYGVFIMATIAFYVIFRSHLLHKKRSDEEEKEEKEQFTSLNDVTNIYENCGNNVSNLLLATSKSYLETMTFLGNEKRKKLKEVYKNVSKINETSKKLKKKIPSVFKELQEEQFESGHYYSEVIDFAREAMHSLFFITSPAYKHVDNNHKPLTEFQSVSLIELAGDLDIYISLVLKDITDSNFMNDSITIEESFKVGEKIVKIRKKQLKMIKKEPGSTRTNILFLDILNETKNLILNINNMYKSFRDFYEQNKKAGARSLMN